MRDKEDKFPETWLERELASIRTGDWSDEAMRYLIFVAKIADLLDDRKADLLQETDDDRSQMIDPGHWSVEVSVPNPTPGSRSASQRVMKILTDDKGREFSCGYEDEEGLIMVCGATMKAENRAEAELKAYEQVKLAVRSLTPLLTEDSASLKLAS